MSKIVSITTLAGEFDKEAMQREFNSLFLKHKQATERILELESEVAHLKDLLASTTPLLNNDPTLDSQILISDEELIVRTQLRRLREKALTRDLMFEEVKAVEMLVKALSTITSKKEGGAIEVSSKKLNLPDTQLLSLAAQPLKDE